MSPSRIKSSEAAKLCGVTSRTIINLALRGEIPGAAKIGNSWTFDHERLIKFISNQEAKLQCQVKKISTNVAKPGGSGRLSTTSNIEKAYAQVMSNSQDD